MSNNGNTPGGHASARSVRVWDPLVRLSHWTVVLCVLLNGTITDPDGNAHEILGYVAGAAVVLRLLWGMIGPAPARFSAFPPNPAAALSHLRDMRTGARSVHVSHNPLGALMVYNIWLTLLAICLTGFMTGTVRFFGVDWVEDAHELAFNWLMISVLLHVAGVFWDQRRTGVGLVRAMITGRKKIPPGWKTK